MADLPKRVLNDQLIRSLKPPPKGQTYCVPDVVVPGLVIRVSPTGSKTFLLRKCWNGANSPTTRKIGRYPTVSLADARGTARAWLELRAEGKDPKHHKLGGDTLGTFMETWLAQRVSTQRRAVQTAREVRNNILPRWGHLALASLTRADVREWIVELTDKGYVRQQRNLFGHLRTFYNWAIDNEHVAVSPCDRVRVASIAGPKRHRERTLTDGEIRALWRAAERMGYPWGTLYQLALLTGARRGELGGMRWSEIDLNSGVWTVPPERFKMNVTHTVPLCQDALSLLRSLPRWEGSDFVLSSSAGKMSLRGYSKGAATLRKFMAADLGSEPDFTLHDCRRTLRTGLAACGVKHEVAELVIGHALPGLAKTYNQYAYRVEMAAALERWARRLRSIVSPGEKVAKFHGARQ